MTSTPPPRDALWRLYRLVLRAYPRDFRARYQSDLLQALDDRRVEPRFQGALGSLRLVLFLLRDLATSVPREWASPSRGWVALLTHDLLYDLRYAVRMLLKNPVFTAAAVATLALGIGLNAATFSTVNGLLLRPLPGARAPDRLVQLYRSWPGMRFGSNSIPHYQDLRDRTGEVFEDVAAWYFAPMSVSAGGRSERIMGTLVSANFFQTYGVTPALGRAFLPVEESMGPGEHAVVVLGYGFWRERFGGDPAVIGRTLTLNGRPFEVVGVAPRGFVGPVSFASVPVYVPLMMQREIEPGRDRLAARGNNLSSVIARLRDGVSLAQAQQVVDATVAQLREEFPDSYEGQTGTALVPQMEAGIHPNFRGAQVGMSAVMMAVVSLLLLIACVNVANLFLARARERRREMGIRLSLGASRARVVRQLLTESLVLAGLACLVGLALAHVTVGVLSNLRPPLDAPWHFSVEMDDRVLLFTVTLSVLAGVLFGLVPATQAARPDLVSTVKGQRGGGGRSRMSSLLVIVQMALSLLLLVSAGLFLRSLQGATRIDPGVDDPSQVVVAAADPRLQGYDTARTAAFWDRVLEEVRALPDVEDAGLSDWLPLGLSASDQGVSVPGYEFGEGEQRSLAFATVSEGFLEALGVDVEAGRTFTRQDDQRAQPVIVINHHMADRFWPGESALGKTVRTAGRDRQVIGVLADGKYRTLGEPPTDMMFLPYRESPGSELSVVTRVRGDPETVLARIQAIVRAQDPDLPLFDVRTLEEHMGMALLPARLGGSVLGLFGTLGLVLAAVGIYGVMAYSVAQRKQEMGIRAAMGADRGAILRLVLREGLGLALVGAALGLAGAAGAARLLQGLLYNVSALDPVAFAGVPLLLVGVAAVAVYIPARRASGLEPMRVLKSD